MRARLGDLFSQLDRWAISSLGEKYNPFTRLGALAVTNLLIAIVTGAFLLPFYSVSVHSAYQSVHEMLYGSGRWYSGIIHSAHRYSSDAAVFFAVLHLFRIIAIRAYDRPRAVSWFTGIVILGINWVIGWIGYWLVWDQSGFVLAQFVARNIDAIPFFGTPISAGLLLDSSVNNQVFFIVFFVHMLLPLAMFILLWIHIYRVARPQFVISKQFSIGLISLLLVLSVLYPAHIDVKAIPLLLKSKVVGDFFYLFMIGFLHDLPPWQVWSISLGFFAFLAFFPWIFIKKNQQPSFVTQSNCFACKQCIHDCPHEAIELKERTDGAKVKGVAWVNPEKCVSCGVCNGACDTFANNLPFLKTQDVQSQIEMWSPKKVENKSKPWLLIACKEIWGGKFTDGNVEGLSQYRVITVPCIGHLNANSVKVALDCGFKGVLIAASLPHSCPYRDGDKIAEERISGKRKPTGGLTPAQRVQTKFNRYGRLQTSQIIEDAVQFSNLPEVRV